MKPNIKLGLLIGLCFGLSLPYLMAARNGSGTYSLPNTGSVPNPVVTGTTISSTWANGTLSDLATEVTDSLSRSGKGGMSAPLVCTAGTASLPSLTFTGDTNTGFYAAAAEQIGVASAGTNVCTFKETTALTCVAAGATNYGGSFTGGATSGSGVLGTGNGAGSGVVGYGGGSNGTGVAGIAGAGSGAGIRGNGGVVTDGGLGGNGGLFYAGTSAHGVYATGDGTAYAGVAGAPSVTSTTTDRTDSFQAIGGDIHFPSPAAPAATTALTNRLTAAAIPKVWGSVYTGSATPSYLSGIHLYSSSAACSSNTITVTFAGSFATTNPTCLVSPNSNVALHCTCVASSSIAGLLCFDAAGAPYDLCAGSIYTLGFLVMGNQN